jgi:TatD DNase family protein
MIDSHAHVAFPQFDADRDQLLARARQQGVRWVEIGTELASSQRAAQLASQATDCVIGATVGVHPSDFEEGVDWAALERLLMHERVVAVGEVGLDYYRGGTREQQLPVLERFVRLALERSLPIVWHVRSGEGSDAHEDMLAFLRSLSRRPAGVMHTFSGTWTQAQAYLELGMHISISGVVTFKKAPDMHEVARRTPISSLLLETDCPYLTPEPYRGARNEPAYVELVARRVAELREISFDEVVAVTEQNALQLFKRP